MCTECTGEELPPSEEIAGALSRLVADVYAEGHLIGGHERGEIDVEDLFFDWLTPYIKMADYYYSLEDTPIHDVETVFEIARTAFNSACLTAVPDNPPMIKYSTENIRIIFFSRREL